MVKANRKTKDMWVKVAIASLLVVILVLIGLVLQTPSVGQAVTVDVPTDQVIDLEFEQELLLNVEDGGEIDFLIKMSGNVGVSTINLSSEFVEEGNGAVSYQLSNTAGTANVLGLLSSEFPESGKIYYDGDATADLRISLVGDYLHVLNLNYVPPAVANITLLSQDLEVIESNMIHVVKDTEVVYLFNISSTKLPAVTAVWEDGDELSAEELFIVGDETSALATLTWTPTEESTAKVLVITATVDDEIAVKKFIFSTDNVVYALLDEEFPEVVMKAVDEGVLGHLTGKVKKK